jgi:hypothetical protein
MLTPNPVQTVYTRYAKVGQVGMPATATGWDIDTRIASDISSPATGIGFGLAVSQGNASDRAACLGLLSGGVFVGITCNAITLPNVTIGFTDVYENGSNMPVMIRGDIWVNAADAVVAGAPVYFNSVTGAFGASGISNATEIYGARWMTSAPTASTDLLKVEVGTLAVVRLIGVGPNV